MAQWRDGARAEAYVKWIGKGAHVFIAEQVSGRPVYICPQKGVIDYTYCFTNVRDGRTMIARID